MKAYKLKENYPAFHRTYQAGRIFVYNEGSPVCIATPKEETIFCGNYIFGNLLHGGLFEEVELEDQKWLQPHICKEVRNKM